MDEICFGYFQPTQGVKQGDRMLISRIKTGLISPYVTSLGCPTITHLAFADDILIFINGGISSLRGLSNLLEVYQNASVN